MRPIRCASHSGVAIPRDFDGTDDNLLSADNVFTGMNVDQRSVAFWIYRDSTPAASQCIAVEATANGAGNGRMFYYSSSPTVAGHRARLFAKWTTDGSWFTPDIALSEWHHVAITYDRGATTNDPVMYVDGVSVTVTETLAPTGTVQGAQDTLKLGENPGGGEDMDAAVAYLTMEFGTIWTSAEVNRHYWWGRRGGSPEVQYPLVTDKLTNDGAVSATLTATGTTVISVPKVQRPCSAMMGMGIGW